MKLREIYSTVTLITAKAHRFLSHLKNRESLVSFRLVSFLFVGKRSLEEFINKLAILHQASIVYKRASKQIVFQCSRDVTEIL